VMFLEMFDPGDLQQGDEVNVICGHAIPDLIEPLFGPFKGKEEILLASEGITWPHLLATLKCFPSASQATKNWRAQKKDPEISPGFSGPLTIGKKRRITIWVWKVIPEGED
jgi:hypothetical protein